MDVLQRIQQDQEYLGPLLCLVDWVAGGNFDGYVYQQRLRFLGDGQTVTLTTTIVDDSRYDGNRTGSSVNGRYLAGDHGTILCNFDGLSMRGVVLGKANELLVFTSTLAGKPTGNSTCFRLEAAT